MAKSKSEEKESVATWRGFDSLRRKYNLSVVGVLSNVKYDDIVDDSDFIPTAERIRNGEFSSLGSTGDVGQYDYPAGEKILEKVSDIVLLLRNGKLDKADVQLLNRVLDEKMKKDHEDKVASDELSKAEKASKNRTAALDAALGVNLEDNTK